ncbi:MAG: integrase [Desulfuromonas sp.]|nr:MAG: integrase [Desulfuromonas sp.]
MTLPLWGQALILFPVGLLAGFLNVLAGGGSLLTLPLLLFLGLPAAVANGTNRIAILCQNIFAISSFRQQGVLPLGLARDCTLPALVGGVIGAQLAVSIDDQLFRRLLALIMIGVLIITLIDPAKRLRSEERPLKGGRKVLLFTGFFFIGLYGGFVQAGVGFIVISLLLMLGIDLVRINAVKVIVILGFTVIALGVFIWHGQVSYGPGLALAAGNALGGWIAPKVAVRKGHSWINRLVSLTVFLFALKLLLG